MAVTERRISLRVSGLRGVHAAPELAFASPMFRVAALGAEASQADVCGYSSRPCGLPTACAMCHTRSLLNEDVLADERRTDFLSRCQISGVLAAVDNTSWSIAFPMQPLKSWGGSGSGRPCQQVGIISVYRHGRAFGRLTPRGRAAAGAQTRKMQRVACGGQAGRRERWRQGNSNLTGKSPKGRTGGDCNTAIIPGPGFLCDVMRRAGLSAIRILHVDTRSSTYV